MSETPTYEELAIEKELAMAFGNDLRRELEAMRAIKRQLEFKLARIKGDLAACQMMLMMVERIGSN